MRELNLGKPFKDKKGNDKYVLLLVALACVLTIRIIRVDSEFLDAIHSAAHLSPISAKTNSNVLSNNTPHISKVGDLFVPGSLNLTRLETIQICHIDPDLYQHHFLISNRWISDQHRLVYVQNRKGGSTNILEKMDWYFDDTTRTNCKAGLPEESVRPQYFVFSMVRDPIDRYVSGFQEMLFRWYADETMRPEYLKSLAEEYVSRRKDHDSVLEALQFFVVHHENGGKLANSHLSLQTTTIRDPTCPSLVLDALYDIHEINDIFENFLKERNIVRHTKRQPQRIRSHSVNITKSDIDAGVLRKICQLTALDYCCLNFKLPPECEGAVQCRWVAPPATRTQEDNVTTEELKIEAVSPYPVKFPV